MLGSVIHVVVDETMYVLNVLVYGFGLERYNNDRAAVLTKYDPSSDSNREDDGKQLV